MRYIVPEGWKLVPIEPTQAMIAACKEALYTFKHRHKKVLVSGTTKVTVRYKAMLRVAPEYEKPEHKFPWET